MRIGGGRSSVLCRGILGWVLRQTDDGALGFGSAIHVGRVDRDTPLNKAPNPMPWVGELRSGWPSKKARPRERDRAS